MKQTKLLLCVAIMTIAGSVQLSEATTISHRLVGKITSVRLSSRVPDEVNFDPDYVKTGDEFSLDYRFEDPEHASGKDKCRDSSFSFQVGSLSFEEHFTCHFDRLEFTEDLSDVDTFRWDAEFGTPPGYATNNSDFYFVPDSMDFGSFGFERSDDGRITGVLSVWGDFVGNGASPLHKGGYRIGFEYNPVPEPSTLLLLGLGLTGLIRIRRMRTIRMSGIC